MLQELFKKFSHPIRGLVYALLHDKAFRFQFYFVGGAVALFYIFFSPITRFEILFLILAWTLILITEVQNTAFEEALDRLHPEIHNSIKKSKDMAAGAVLLAGFFLVIVMITIVFF